MGGWIALKRGSHDHPLFSKKPERYFVWTWILATAAWRDTRQDADGKIITVKRAQLLTSYRQIRNSTGVGIKVIRTLVGRLEEERAIVTDTGTGRLLITICNYDKYQFSESHGAHLLAQDGRSVGTQNKQKNTIPIGANESPPPFKPPEITGVTSALWAVGKRYLAQHNVSNPGGMIGKWLSQSDGNSIEVLAAIEAAQKAGTQNPVPYVQKIISANRSKNAGGGTHAGAFGFIPEVG